MDPDLHRLITDFVATVARRFAQLQREVGVATPLSSIEWALSGLKKGVLSDGATYSRHGVGCLIEAPEGGVDFDFGDNGEIDGFDAWRLFQFADDSSGRHTVIETEEIQSLLDSAVASGEVEKRGSLYYLRSKGPNQPPQTRATSGPV